MITEAVLVAVVLGVTEAIKRAGLSVRYIPLLAIVLGYLAWSVVNGFGMAGIILGIAVGLSACGLWDFGKRTVLGK